MRVLNVIKFVLKAKESSLNKFLVICEEISLSKTNSKTTISQNIRSDIYYFANKNIRFDPNGQNFNDIIHLWRTVQRLERINEPPI